MQNKNSRHDIVKLIYIHRSDQNLQKCRLVPFNIKLWTRRIVWSVWTKLCFHFSRTHNLNSVYQFVVLHTLWLAWLAIINVFIVFLDELTWWLVSNIVPVRDRFPVVDDTCKVLSSCFKRSKINGNITQLYYYYYYYLNKQGSGLKAFAIFLKTWNRCMAIRYVIHGSNVLLLLL